MTSYIHLKKTDQETQEHANKQLLSLLSMYPFNHSLCNSPFIWCLYKLHFKVKMVESVQGKHLITAATTSLNSLWTNSLAFNLSWTKAVVGLNLHCIQYAHTAWWHTELYSFTILLEHISACIEPKTEKQLSVSPAGRNVALHDFIQPSCKCSGFFIFSIS